MASTSSGGDHNLRRQTNVHSVQIISHPNILLSSKDIPVSPSIRDILIDSFRHYNFQYVAIRPHDEGYIIVWPDSKYVQLLMLSQKEGWDIKNKTRKFQYSSLLTAH